MELEETNMRIYGNCLAHEGKYAGGIQRATGAHETTNIRPVQKMREDLDEHVVVRLHPR